MKGIIRTGIATGTVLTAVAVGALGATPAMADPAVLEPNEAAALTFSRDEERLARDLYSALGELYPEAAVFGITASEQRHFDAVGTLLDRYGLDDPADGVAAGTYPDELQTLYDSWLEQGSESLDAAYAVGIELEKRDIADLKDELTRVDNADIERVLGHLLAGSENHLSAFTAAADGQTVGVHAGAGRSQADGQSVGRANGTGAAACDGTADQMRQGRGGQGPSGSRGGRG